MEEELHVLKEEQVRRRAESLRDRTPTPTLAPRLDGCYRNLMFLHQQKAAGESVRLTLQAYADAHAPRIQTPNAPRGGGLIYPGSYLGQTRVGRCGGCEDFHWRMSDTRPWCSGCPQRLWLTMVREPWSRMRSQ